MTSNLEQRATCANAELSKLTMKELEADAHLIAAAPEMYETLEEAELFLAGVQLLDGTGNNNPSALGAKIKAILIKARGEED